MRRALQMLSLSASLLSLATPSLGQLRADKRADLAQPVVLQPNQAVIVVGFRRPDKMSAGKSGAVAFARYDTKNKDMIFQPRDAKKSGDTTTYTVLARSGERTLSSDYAVMIVSAGDYVMTGASPGPDKMAVNSFCLAAPTFHVSAGEAIYFGDVTPYIFAKMANGSLGSAMAYSSHLEEAQKALASQPFAATLKAAVLKNDATFRCLGQAMLAYQIPGAASIGVRSTN